MPSEQGTKNTAIVPFDLTETEQDLLGHLRNGYELETDPLGGDPVLRPPRGQGEEVMRGPSPRHGIQCAPWKSVA